MNAMSIPKLANKEFLLKVPKVTISENGKYLGTSDAIVDQLSYCPSFYSNTESMTGPWAHYNPMHCDIDKFLRPGIVTFVGIYD